jgi:hypothetical protein
MRVRILLSALLVMSGSVLRAEEPTWALGLGTQSCAKFAKVFQANPERTEAMFFSWAAGFMTGLNVAGGPSPGPQNLAAMSFEEKQQFMRRFCDQYPLKAYMDGVMELYGALPVSQPAR